MLGILLFRYAPTEGLCEIVMSMLQLRLSAHFKWEKVKKINIQDRNGAKIIEESEERGLAKSYRVEVLVLDCFAENWLQRRWRRRARQA